MGETLFATARGKRPRFEEQDVHADRLTIKGVTLDLDFPLTIDEKVEITIKAVVVGVHHDVDQRTGALVRKHILKTDVIHVEENQ